METPNPIEEWLEENCWVHDEVRHSGQTCYAGPAGGYLVIDPGDDAEPAFWCYYAPGNEQGEQADQAGSWQDVPTI